MMRDWRLSVIAVVFSFLLLPVGLFAREAVATQVHFTIQLARGGTANIAATVLMREGPPSGETVLFVPGFAQTAATFDALGRALFRQDFGNKVFRVILIDHPGHGNSGYPIGGVPFGGLAIEDYAAALIHSL